MQPPVQKIILLPRFTSFAGEATFLTAPINVRRFANALVAFNIDGQLPGVTVTTRLEESTDLEIWTEAVTLGSSGEPELVTFKHEWVRLSVALTGGDPGITCWCVGNFVPRDVNR